MMFGLLLRKKGSADEGKWIDLVDYSDVDDICAEVLGVDEDGDPVGYSDELEIMDWEIDGDYPDSTKVSVNSDVEELREFANWFNDLDSYDQEAFLAICEVGYCEAQDNVSTFESGNYSYISGVDDYDDVGRYLINEGLYGNIPDELEYYIDYDKLGEDSDYTLTEKGAIAVY